MKTQTLPVMLWVILFLAACGPEAWEQDPAVQAARKTCKRLGKGMEYDCVERHAVRVLNPDICRLAGIWIDDTCLQAVYEAADDPAICERLYLEGVRPTCRAYYADKATRPPGFTVLRSDQFPMEVALPQAGPQPKAPKALRPPSPACWP